jgi:hypothetical protein
VLYEEVGVINLISTTVSTIILIAESQLVELFSAIIRQCTNINLLMHSDVSGELHLNDTAFDSLYSKPIKNVINNIGFTCAAITFNKVSLITIGGKCAI